MKKFPTILFFSVLALASSNPMLAYGEKLCVKNSIRVKKNRINLRRAFSVQAEQCPKRTTEVTAFDTTTDIDTVNVSAKPVLEGVFVVTEEKNTTSFPPTDTITVLATCPQESALLGGTCPSTGFPIVLLDAKISGDGRVWSCKYENASSLDRDLGGTALITKALCAPL